MSKAELIGLIEQCVEADPGSSTETQDLKGLESWDSLTIVSLIALVDETLGVTMDAQKILDALTIGDLVRIITDARSKN